MESFNRVLLSGRSLVFSYPTVHTQQSSVPNGVAEHKDPLAGPGAGRGPHRRGQAGGQPPRIVDAAGQPAAPSQPHEGSLGALPLPFRPCGYTTTRCATSSAAWVPAPQLHCWLSHERVLSGVSTRLGNLARFTFKGLDGTMTDLFIHLVA